MLPPRSNTMNRVLVVPWSIAPTYRAMVFPIYLACVRIRFDEVGEKIPADVHRSHAAAFVQAMRAIAIGITPPPRSAVHRNADGLEKNAVGGARRHGRNQRHTGEIFRDEFFGRR